MQTTCKQHVNNYYSLCFIYFVNVSSYMARLQQIAALSLNEVGSMLIRIAREAHAKRMDDCSSDGKGTIKIPIKFSFKKEAPFVQVRDLEFKTCHMPEKYLEDIYNSFKDCFLHELKGFGPKLIAIWKNSKPGALVDYGAEASCSPDDNFAITLKLKVSAATKLYMASGGGGIGLAFGCKNGKMKQELIFDYEAGFEFTASPIPLTIAFHQNVGFLREWPTHHSKFFSDVGNLRLTLGIPRSASMLVQIALNEVCRRALPDVVRDVVCGKAIPQNVQMMFDPPQYDLNILKPKFSGFEMVGLQLGWAFNLFEKAKGQSSFQKAIGVSKTRNGMLGLKSVVAKSPKKTSWTDFSHPSVGAHYGNTHVFGTIFESTTPCQGWPGSSTTSGFNHTWVKGSMSGTVGGGAECSRVPFRGCLFDKTRCIEKYDGQCGILETEAEAVCLAWDACGGVVCKADYGGYCLARRSIDRSTKSGMWAYRKESKWSTMIPLPPTPVSTTPVSTTPAPTPAPVRTPALTPAPTPTLTPALTPTQAPIKVCSTDLKKCADGSFLSRDANCNFPKCKATAPAKSKDEAAKAAEAEAAKAEADAAKTNAAKTNAANANAAKTNADISMVSNGQPTEPVVTTDSNETEDSFMSRPGHPGILVLLGVGLAVGILASVLVVFTVRARHETKRVKERRRSSLLAQQAHVAKGSSAESVTVISPLEDHKNEKIPLSDDLINSKWSIETDVETGDTYYWNTETDETTWEMPSEISPN